MRTVAFCEIEPFCQRILAKHWPGIPIHHDVTKLRGSDVGAVDVICGGFPCQDISLAGLGAGLAGERSGLWREYARIIGELRPKFVIVENVAALLHRGLDQVLGDLAALGYDAEWHCIPASAVGAPHRRDRIWIIAYAGSQQYQGNSAPLSRALAQELFKRNTDAAGERCQEARQLRCIESEEWASGIRKDVADATSAGLSLTEHPSGFVEEAERVQARAAISGTCWWATEPDVGRVANGIPSRVDRLKGLGNAVVPQIPELIGRAIMKVASADVR